MSERVATLLGLSATSPLFEVALTHPSYANEARDARHYQRLEFLGDAVLGLCASELLFERFPAADEGSLTRMRARLVNADALAAWARESKIGDALRLGRGAETNKLRDSTNVLADLVEALVAVAFLDSGIDGARYACKVVLEPAIALLEADSGRDPKSELQERVQKTGGATPTYEVLESGGSSHAPWFLVGVEVGGTTLGQGRGRSKRAAERAAATAALEVLSRDTAPVEGTPEPDHAE
ncbi:MAG TPA: ribonuclease III [Polyangiaceae bacterium]|jgi:ribonuclease-3|nr:ribonuclease III [Polyangiaceae bacterium]